MRSAETKPGTYRMVWFVAEAAGFVGRKPDPKDGRQTFLSLTPSFVKILKTGRAVKEDWLLALQAQLAPRQHGQLAAALTLLSRLADF